MSSPTHHHLQYGAKLNYCGTGVPYTNTNDLSLPSWTLFPHATHSYRALATATWCGFTKSHTPYTSQSRRLQTSPRLIFTNSQPHCGTIIGAPPASTTMTTATRPTTCFTNQFTFVYPHNIQPPRAPLSHPGTCSAFRAHHSMTFYITLNVTQHQSAHVTDKLKPWTTTCSTAATIQLSVRACLIQSSSFSSSTANSSLSLPCLGTRTSCAMSPSTEFLTP